MGKPKAWKRVVDNKMQSHGDTNYQKKIIRVNKTKANKTPMYKRPVNKKASRYPDVLGTIVHEETHRKHPKMREQMVRKKERVAVKTMSRSSKAKHYSRYK